MTNPIKPFIRDLLTGKQQDIVGRSAILARAVHGIDIEFYTRPRGNVVYLAWTAIIQLQPAEPHYYIYYNRNIVSIVWGVGLKSVKRDDPYAHLKAKEVRKEQMIKRNRRALWK